MKSKISRRSFLRNIAAAGSGAAALGLLAGCSSSSTAASSGSTAAAEDKYTPGTYSASKTISYSEIGVSMTFDANSITACEITSSGEQDLLTDDKKTAMAKAIVEGQSADVDAVTSCTLVASVGAIQECVADCIAQATGTEVEKPETTEVTGRVPGYCGPGDWLGEAPADPDKYEDAGTYDVVIVGGGHAGVGAAFGAVDEGATVAVIEKQPWGNFVDLDGTGTNMGGWYGEDIGHVNSKLLIERGYGPYDTGAITSEFCKRAAGRVNPEIIKNFVQYSGQMFDRYEEIYDSYEEERKANDSDVYLADTAVIVPKATGDGKTGDQWVDGEPAGGAGHYDMSDMFQYPLCNTQAAYGQHKASYPISCGGYLTWPCNAQFYGYQGNNIEYIHKYIVKYVQETPNCAWDFEREGIKLIQDESGKVTGVYAKGADGTYYRYNCNKGVILCAGDFIGNPEMCWALLNEGMEWAERSGATADSWASAGTRNGQGHKMACWAGGMIEPTPRGWMAIGGGASGPWGTAPMLMLNSRGKRFMNEDLPGQQLENQIELQKNRESWQIFDSNWPEQLPYMPAAHGGACYYEDYASEDEGPKNNTTYRNYKSPYQLEAAVADGRAVKADTLEELVAKIYPDDTAAQQTALDSIQRYNELAKAGYDEDFHKPASRMWAVENGPFYADKFTTALLLVCIGGLESDEDCHTFDADRNVIPGLYVAGNIQGNRFATEYPIGLKGVSHSMAMYYGYIAGKNALKDI